MKQESLYVAVGGHDLHRVVMSPDDGMPLRAVMICYHGQGDYAERYGDVLGLFTQYGILCVVTELLGHGHSPGKRGHCGDGELLDAVIENTLTEYVAPENLPYGVMGHSMGGLLATRHVVLAGMGKFPSLSFAWLSSPLVNPANGRAAWFVKMVQTLSYIMPSVTISTKVKSADCRVKSEKVVTSVAKNELWHSRVSLGWGALLIGFAGFIEKNISSVSDELPILITQGSEDTVCPAEQTRKLVAALPSEGKHYVELEGMLHEPFKGEGSELLFIKLEAWLKGVLPSIEKSKV